MWWDRAVQYEDIYCVMIEKTLSLNSYILWYYARSFMLFCCTLHSLRQNYFFVFTVLDNALCSSARHRCRKEIYMKAIRASMDESEYDTDQGSFCSRLVLTIDSNTTNFSPPMPMPCQYGESQRLRITKAPNKALSAHHMAKNHD